MKTYLTDSQVEELINNNLYHYAGNIFRARCFSADYSNSPELPVLSMPGGDIGQIAILIAASSTYGFELNITPAVNILLKLTEGKENSTFKALKEHPLELCHYVYSLLKHSNDYGLDEQGKIELLRVSEGLGLPKEFNLLESENHENACVIIEAEDGLLPNYTFDSGYGVLNAKILVFHKTYIDKRNRELCNLWVKNDAVKMFSGLDADYLYQIMSEMTELHLFQTLKLRDPQLPLYSASVLPNNKVSVKVY